MESLRKMVVELIIIPLLIIFYTYQCWTLAGYIGPLCIYAYFIISSITSRILINPIVDAIFYKESAEGYFRYTHHRIDLEGVDRRFAVLFAVPAFMAICCSALKLDYLLFIHMAIAE